MNAAECARQVSDVFVLPETCLKIKEIIDNHVSDMDEIAELIQFDPVLSSRLLKLANSALYSFPQQVDSVEKAVLLLGENQVYNLVVAYGAAEAFATIDPKVIQLERFWEQSIYCALLAKYLGLKANLNPKDPVYLTGLLHNLGELVMIEVNPDAARKCQLGLSDQHPWQLQQQMLGFTYADCSAELLRCWQLPQRLVSPLLHLHQPEMSQGIRVNLVIHIAACCAISLINKERYPLKNVLDMQLVAQAGLTEEQLQEAMDFAVLEGMAILSLLNPSLFTVL